MLQRKTILRFCTSRSRCNIFVMVVITVCVLGYEWQWENNSVNTKQPITLTLSDSILPKDDRKEAVDFNMKSVSATVPKPRSPYLYINMSSLERMTAVLNSSMISLNQNVPIITIPTSFSNPDSELEFYWNIRKLNVFAVHEMNRIIKSSNFSNLQCIKWWSNPLNTTLINELYQTPEYYDRELTFVVHPGYFIFNVQIRQRKPPIDLDQNELEILRSFKTIPSSMLDQHCLGKDTSEEIKSVCHCENTFEEFATALDSETLQERIKWNITDPELITWRLHKSFSVEDYLNFTNYDTFMHSPGKLNQTAREQYCQPSTRMLIMVSSAPQHFFKRQIIRQTYGMVENLHPKGVRLVFLMGKLTGNDYQKDLLKEISMYDDIIVEDFADSYHNLTLSHLSMYKWIYLTCTQDMPTHVLKADDDFFINIDLALSLVEVNPDVEYMGCLYCGTKPIRNVAYMTKYYTPRYMYMPDVYVGYLSGVAYIFKTDIIPRVLHASLTIPIIHMDDVYMTGLIPRLLKVHPRNSRLITYGRIEPDSCLLKKTVSSCVLNPEDMLLQWKKWIEPAPSNCSMSDIDYHMQVLDEKTTIDCYFV